MEFVEERVWISFRLTIVLISRTSRHAPNISHFPNKQPSWRFFLFILSPKLVLKYERNSVVSSLVYVLLCRIFVHFAIYRISEKSRWKIKIAHDTTYTHTPVHTNTHRHFIRIQLFSIREMNLRARHKLLLSFWCIFLFCRLQLLSFSFIDWILLFLCVVVV